MSVKEIKVFICYSSRNAIEMDTLKKQLEERSIGNKEFRLNIWACICIDPGKKWKEVIREKMKETDCALLLLSMGFTKSNFIQSEELPLLLKREKEEKISLIPIKTTFVEDCHLPDEITELEYYTPPGCIKKGEIPQLRDLICDEDKGQLLETRLDKTNVVKYFNQLHHSIINNFKNKIDHEKKDNATIQNIPQHEENIILVEDLPHIREAIEGNGRKIQSILSTDSISKAFNKMKINDIRHLIVLEDNKLCGIASFSDVIKELIINNKNEFEKKDIKYIIRNQQLISRTSSTPIKDVIRLFCNPQMIREVNPVYLRCIPIKLNQNKIEIISYIDILKNLSLLINQERLNIFLNKNINNVFENDIQKPMTRTEDLIIEDALTEMVGTGFRTLAIVNKNQDFIGMVSKTTIQSIYNNGRYDNNSSISPFIKRYRETLQTFSYQTSMSEVIEAFTKEKMFTSLPVIENDNLVRVISYVDILSKIHELLENNNG